MQQVIIYDGFYNNPEQMKSLFSDVDYIKNENFIKGQICPMNFANDEMLRHMEFICTAPEGAYEFVEGSGSFIINTESDLPDQTVCVNLPDITTQWVGIISLNESSEPHYLKFYKHKRTGWDRIPSNPEEFEKENISSFDDFSNFMLTENADIDNWIETNRFLYKQNQLILFRPGLFHSYSDVFGDTKQNGRLLQMFFLKPKSIELEQE